MQRGVCSFCQHHSDDRLGTFLSSSFIRFDSDTHRHTEERYPFLGTAKEGHSRGKSILLGSHHGITAELAQTDQLKTLQKTLKKQKHDLLKKINETIFKFMQIEEGKKW